MEAILVTHSLGRAVEKQVFRRNLPISMKITNAYALCPSIPHAKLHKDELFAAASFVKAKDQKQS